MPLSHREDKVVTLLADAWNAYVELEQTEGKLHDDHIHELRHAIHVAQNIVMCRPIQHEFNTELALEAIMNTKEPNAST